MFTKQYTTLKVILYGALVTVYYLLQSVPAFGLRFMSKTPELLLVLTVCVAFFESYTFASFFGLCAGILNDIVTADIVGGSAIAFMFFGFFIAVLLQTVFRRFFLTYISISLITIIVFLLLEYSLRALFFGGIPFVSALTNTILPKFLLTGVAAYPTYAIVRFISVKFCPGGDSRN